MHYSFRPPIETFPMSFSEVNRKIMRMGSMRIKHAAILIGSSFPAPFVATVNLYRP